MCRGVPFQNFRSFFGREKGYYHDFGVSILGPILVETAMSYGLLGRVGE